MATFDLKEFVLEPDWELLEKVKKAELVNIAAHYEIAVDTRVVKKQLLKTLVEGLAEKGLITDIDEIMVENEAPPVVKQDVKTDSKDEIRLKELELEAKRLDSQIENKRMDLKAKELELDHELKLKEQEMTFRLGMKELEVQEVKDEMFVPNRGSPSKFDPSRHVRLVPPFDEKDVDKYFLHFEKVASSLEWPQDVWTLLLQSVLKGKAQEVYSSLSVAQSADYTTVKETILKSYELVPEAYRQKFRNLRKLDGATYVEFARGKEDLFQKWCTSTNTNDVDDLRNLILVEEFKRCLPADVRTFLDEHKVKNLHDAAVLADDYALTHKGVFGKKIGYQNMSIQNSKPNSQIHATSSGFHAQGARGTSPSVRVSSLPDNIKAKGKCFYCKKEGHRISDCRVLQRKNASGGGNALKQGMLVVNYDKSSDQLTGTRSDLKFEGVVESEYLPFVSQGCVGMVDENNSVPVTILRDTGASQSLILTSVLDFCDRSYTGRNVLIQGVECSEVLSVPLHSICLRSDLCSGTVVVGIRPSLPVKGITFILGNDLAGGKVRADPIVCMPQNIERLDDDGLGKQFPEVFQSCVVTRAQALSRGLSVDHGDDVDDDCDSVVDLGETLTLFESNQSSSVRKVDSENSTSSHREKVGEKPQGSMFMFSTDQLIKEQKSDSELDKLFDRAVEVTDSKLDQVCYYTDHGGVLMRRWRPSDAPANEEYRVRHQIVVPENCRREVLELAHGSPLGSHFGIRKTYYRILLYFFWPGLRKDVVKHCRECHTCQVVGKPNQRIPKYPLQPIPSMGEAFSKVIIDCVGPLPRTSSGNEFLLTIMCTATRFPEAIPLRTITARSVIKALIRYFSWVGLPKHALQSDNGSNFLAKVFDQVMQELRIKHITSSPYHPESQGALERFHSTLKNMLRAYCFENQKSWDEGVPLVLFAARECEQESLGFSPFQLVFGHEVRGPLKLLQEKLLENGSERIENGENLLDYVSKFRQRLLDSVELATSNLETSQLKMKSLYDQKCKERKFEVGDLVLALLPLQGNCLQAKYFHWSFSSCQES